MEALTKSELRRLFEIGRERDFGVYVLMLLQYWHPGRNSEMIALTRDNFRDGYIHFKRLKGSEPCHQKLVRSKDTLYDEVSALGNLLNSVRGNQRLYPRSRWTYWRHVVALALEAGIPRHKAKTTVLKHSICTHLIEKLPPNAVQRRAGHVNGANTLRYAKLRESQVDELISDGNLVLA